MLMLGQLQMNECPLRWITIDDLRAESLVEATPKGSDSNFPCYGQGGTECPGPIDQELWQHEIPHARMASCELRTKIGRAGRREQYGNNLGRKPSQMIPNHPKSALL
jgi:hypothetical protein